MIKAKIFSSQLVLEIYKKYRIEKTEMYHVLTDTDSIALQFIIIYDPNSDISEPKFRDIIYIIFEIIVATKITSDLIHLTSSGTFLTREN